MSDVVGYKGISFPFRIGIKGGVVTSTTNVRDIPHIIEAMTQILSTSRFERCMEFHIYSEVDTNIFEVNDESCHALLAYQVKDALSALEDRIQVQKVTITSEENTIYADITFSVTSYYDKTYNTKIKVGDANVENSY